MKFFSRFFGPPSKEKFAKLFMTKMKDVGDQRVPSFDPNEFRITWTQDGEDAGVTNLGNIYAEYCQHDRKYRAKYLQTTCLTFAKNHDIPDEFDDARPDLRPTLKPRSYLDIFRRDSTLSKSKPIELAAVPVSQHLVACLVYDLPHSMNFVTTEQLEKWGTSIYEAMEVALENLDGQPGMMMTIGDKIFILQSGDAYDATRLLKTDKIKSLSVIGDPVALEINRDCLMVTGSDDPEGLKIMADLAETNLDDPRPICSIPVRLQGEEWHTWMPPDDNPAIEKYRKFAIRYFAGEYHEQKEHLDRLHESEGPDVFVASYGVVEFKDGRIRSYSVWSKGVPTWLPETDDIAFMDPDADTHDLVSWEHAVKIVGDAMTRLDVYPERWAVDSFPDDEHMAELRKGIVPNAGA